MTQSHESKTAERSTGSTTRPGKPKRLGDGITVRAAGRGVALIGIALVVVGMVLPWIAPPPPPGGAVRGVGETVRLSALEVPHDPIIWGEYAMHLSFDRWAWVPPAVIYGMALLVLLLFIDQARNLRRWPAYLAMLLGGLSILVPAYLFLMFEAPKPVSARIFRNFGPLVTCMGGMVLDLGGMLLLAPWLPAPAKRRMPSLRQWPWAPVAVSAVLALCFVALVPWQGFGALLRTLGLQTGAAHAHQFVTHLLLHADVVQLALVILVLLGCGALVRRAFGTGAALSLMLGGAAAGVGAMLLLARVPSWPQVGAGGAAFALAGACLAALPEQRMRLWYWNGFTAGWTHPRVSVFVGAAALVLSLRALLLHDVLRSDARWASVGGLLFGLLVGLLLRLKVRGRRDEEPKRDETLPDDQAPARKPLLPAAVWSITVILTVWAAVASFSAGSLVHRAGTWERAWNAGDMETTQALMADGTTHYQTFLQRHIGGDAESRTMLTLRDKGPLGDQPGYAATVYDVDAPSKPTLSHLVAYWHRDRESGAWRLTSMREEYQKPAAQTEASPAE